MGEVGRCRYRLREDGSCWRMTANETCTLRAAAVKADILDEPVGDSRLSRPSWMFTSSGGSAWMKGTSPSLCFSVVIKLIVEKQKAIHSDNSSKVVVIRAFHSLTGPYWNEKDGFEEAQWLRDGVVRKRQGWCGNNRAA